MTKSNTDISSSGYKILTYGFSLIFVLEDSFLKKVKNKKIDDKIRIIIIKKIISLDLVDIIIIFIAFYHSLVNVIDKPASFDRTRVFELGKL